MPDYRHTGNEAGEVATTTGRLPSRAPMVWEQQATGQARVSQLLGEEAAVQSSPKRQKKAEHYSQ